MAPGPVFGSVLTLATGVIGFEVVGGVVGGGVVGGGVVGGGVVGGGVVGGGVVGGGVVGGGVVGGVFGVATMGLPQDASTAKLNLPFFSTT